MTHPLANIPVDPWMYRNAAAVVAALPGLAAKLGTDLTADRAAMPKPSQSEKKI